MANLPSQHPTLSIHLADLALTPLITSARSPSHLESLTSLASAALSAHTAAQRAQLGRPQRVMVEYPDAGPVLLQTYLDPCDAGAGFLGQAGSSSSSSGGGGGTGVGVVVGGAPGSDGVSGTRPPPVADREPGLHRDDAETGGGGDGCQEPSVRPGDVAPVLVGLVVAATSDEARDARRAAARVERVGRQFQREWTAQSTVERGSETSTE